MSRSSPQANELADALKRVLAHGERIVVREGDRIVGAIITPEELARLEKLGPGTASDQSEQVELTNDELLEFVRQHPAPQSWWDETDDPFQPARTQET